MMSFLSKSATPDAFNAYLVKKKRGNKSAKLGQGKLDVRRQKLLLEEKNKGCEEESIGGEEVHVPPMHEDNGRDQATRALEVMPTNGEKDGTMHNGTDSDSFSNSPSSRTGSVVESNCSGTNFTGSTGSCSSGTSFSRNTSEVEDDGGLDDWEAVADALDLKFESFVENQNVAQFDHLPKVVKQPTCTVDVPKPKPGKCEQKFGSLVENKNVTQSDHLPEVVKPTSTVDVWKPKPEKRDQKFKSLVENKNATQLDHLPEVVNQPTATVEVWKPKPENSQAWRRSDALRWKPKTEKRDQKCKSWVENKNVTQLDHQPGVVNQPTAPVDFWKPKPENGQAWRRSDAFHWKPKTEKRDHEFKSWVENKNVTQLDHLPKVVKQPNATVDVLKPKSENGQAWRRGDAFRPKSFPDLQKNHSYPMKANVHCHGGTTLGCKSFVSPPSPCPICCEDLDSTDSSFLPCSCGFQLCLFCHKRILEEDGRCPGCRKHYDNSVV